MQRIFAEPQPDVAHLLAIGLAIVRQHVGDEQPAAGAQHARGLGERLRRDPAGGAARATASRRRARRPRSAALRARPAARRRWEDRGPGGGRRLQHVARAIDGDDLLDERRQRRGDLARAASQIADDPLGIEQSRQRLQVATRARTGPGAGGPTAPPRTRRTPVTCSAAGRERRGAAGRPDRRPASG